MKFKAIDEGWVVCDQCGHVHSTGKPGPEFWPNRCVECRGWNLWRFTDSAKAYQHSFFIFMRQDRAE